MNRYDGRQGSNDSEDRLFAFNYIGSTATQNLQAALPNNRVEMVGSQFDKDSNRLNLKLKVHGQDQSTLQSVRYAEISNFSGAEVSSDQMTYLMKPKGVGIVSDKNSSSPKK